MKTPYEECQSKICEYEKDIKAYKKNEKFFHVTILANIIIIMLIFVEVNKYQEYQRVHNTVIDKTFMMLTKYKYTKMQCDSITDWRIFMKESNPQEIQFKLNKEKKKRLLK